MTTTTPEPEQRSPQERVVKINEEFQLFGPDLSFYQDSPYNAYSHLELQLKEGLPIKDLGVVLGFWPCFAVDTVTPLDPESGYSITNEDFDPRTRAQKLKNLIGPNGYSVSTGNREEMLWLGCEGEDLEPYRSELEQAEELDRLALIVTVNGQSYLSKPDIFMDAIGTGDYFMWFMAFKPIDFKED